MGAPDDDNAKIVPGAPHEARAGSNRLRRDQIFQPSASRCGGPTVRQSSSSSSI
jgi:hypothetical protein